jgi:ABC-type thiamine transport system substrate-binding protein
MPRTSSRPAIRWLSSPEAHDYPAAKSYLSLIYEDAEVKKFVRRLKALTASARA